MGTLALPHPAFSICRNLDANTSLGDFSIWWRQLEGCLQVHGLQFLAGWYLVGYHHFAACPAALIRVAA